MKKLPFVATISTMLALLAVLASPTSVTASPARIEEPSFETVANWAYSETNVEFTDGVRSTAWKTQGTYSYLFSNSSPQDITKNDYCQILQSVTFTSIDRISFDTYLYADSVDFSARILVGAVEVWTLAVPETATEYLHQEVDLSGYTGLQNLIIRIYCLGSAPNANMNCYFDNIKIWGSHSDATWQTVENTFTGSTNHVYMYGENFDVGTIKVGYYDGGDVLRETDTYSAFGGGVLNGSECLFTDYAGVATEGTWHAVVLQTATSLPDNYNDAIIHANYVADDVFFVDATAIPEFPTVIAGVGVAGLCFGIYWWMRKRRPV